MIYLKQYWGCIPVLFEISVQISFRNIEVLLEWWMLFVFLVEQSLQLGRFFSWIGISTQHFNLSKMADSSISSTSYYGPTSSHKLIIKTRTKSKAVHHTKSKYTHTHTQPPLPSRISRTLFLCLPLKMTYCQKKKKCLGVRTTYSAKHLRRDDTQEAAAFSLFTFCSV